MNILREAFRKVGDDREFKEDAMKSKMLYEYLSADDALKFVKYVFSQPEEIVREFLKYNKAP